MVCLGNTKRKVECHLAFRCSPGFRCVVLRYGIWLLALQHRPCLEENQEWKNEWLFSKAYEGLLGNHQNSLLHVNWTRFKLAETKWQSIIYSAPSPIRSSTLRKTLIKIFEGSWQSWKWVASVKQEEIGVLFQILCFYKWTKYISKYLFYIVWEFSLRHFTLYELCIRHCLIPAFWWKQVLEFWFWECKTLQIKLPL